MNSSFENQRKAMVEYDLKRRHISNEVLHAFEKIPREEFVGENQKQFAYEDFPLPIGFEQTISQPYVIALMTQLLELHKEDVVLEIGTGSGYQAAILSQLVSHVDSLEIIKELAEKAKENLSKCNISNVVVYSEDGSVLDSVKGEKYDKIICTAATDAIPSSWRRVLKEKGLLIFPEGDKEQQFLVIYRKCGNELIREYDSIQVKFVPVTGSFGASWK